MEGTHTHFKKCFLCLSATCPSAPVLREGLKGESQKLELELEVILAI